MSLSAKDKDVVRAFWATVSGSSESIGAEAVCRMLTVYPQTKTYFSHWKDLSPTSASARNHGIIVMNGIGDAVTKIDNLVGGFLTLSELHAFTLRVDPANFKLLAHCILVAMALAYPDEFTPEVHVSMDKFLAAVARALSEKYR
ncbi:hemoglobin subunit alpha-2-like [Epinephelus lanceolatus]|uniref:hemoglobin subunit alpha-2-like n=1 Tax=Epinephelus lanceolatus TaxID=310571 RepID=UPI001446EDD1|nr:hemoglobin subunit alpha-2-like [Epinephelus lanceolatus]